MLMLPPPVSKRTRMIAAARRRGVAITIIARGLGVSKQAIGKTVEKFERYYGSVSVPLTTHVKNRSRTRVIKCPACGNFFEKGTGQNLTQHCSEACYGLSLRILTVEQVKWAIEQRTVNMQTWTAIAQILETNMQTVQSNIWFRLSEENRLSKNIVEKIWRGDEPRRGGPGSWNWLISRTGVSPRETP